MGDISDCIQQLSSSTEFKKALKVLIKYEINCLLKRLSDTGEEAFVITTSIDDGLQGHLGTVKGEGFLLTENTVHTLKQKFIQFCTGSGVLRDTQNEYGRDSPVDFSHKISFVPKRISYNNHIDETCSNEDVWRNQTHRNVDVTGYTDMVTIATPAEKSSLKDVQQSPEPTNEHESMYFHESEGGDVCEASRRKILKSDSEVHTNEKGDTEAPLNNDKRFSWSLKSKCEENEKDKTCTRNFHLQKCNRQCEDISSCTLKMDRLESEYVMDKNMSLHKQNTSDRKISENIPEVDNLEIETGKINSLNSSPHAYTRGYKDRQYAAWKMFDEFPHFSYHSNGASPSDIDYLNQCYFRGMTNEHEGELLDFSMKKESQHSPLESNPLNHLDNSFNGSVIRGKDSSNIDGYRSADRGYINEIYANTWKDNPRECTELRETSSDHRNRTECTVTSEIRKANGEVVNIKREPCDKAMNLKMEPDSASVKIEPGTNCLNYTVLDKKSHRDRKSKKAVSPELGAALTMQLNFNCKICGQVFKNRQYRDFHVKAHGSSCQYFCSLCSQGFHSEMDYKKHLNEHSEPVFHCETCGYRCTREFRMRAHKEICGSPNKVYKCLFCHKQFAAQRYMRIHIKSHDAQNIHTCPICQNTYPLKNSLLKHMKKKHGQMQS